MKYVKFEIKNYKGIENIEIDLSRKPNIQIFTLVGLNESGKTSVLEAINLFQNNLPKEQAHTLIPKHLKFGFTGTISISATLEFEDNELETIIQNLADNWKFKVIEPSKEIIISKLYSFENSQPLEDGKWYSSTWSWNFQGKQGKRKKVRPLYNMNNEAWQATVNLIKEDYLPKILYYPNFLFEFPEKIFLTETSISSQRQREYRQIIQDLLLAISPDLTIEKNILENIQNLTMSSKKESWEALRLKMSNKMDQEILNQWEAIFKSTTSKKINIGPGSGVNENGEAEYYLEFHVHQGSDSYSINDRSLGFRWFFSFLLFTHFRKQRASDPGETLFLLDEPASNLHQSSQQMLLESLASIVSDSKLIYSTHSHHLINPKWLAGTYIIRNKAVHGDPIGVESVSETKIEATLYKNFVAQYPKEDDHFRPILDALDFRPSELEMVPSIVFTEGKNDYFTFKYFSEVIFDEKYSLQFYPGAGVDKYNVPFSLYLSWNKPFVAVFDSDEAGINAQKKYIGDIGPEMETRVFTFKDINPKFVETVTENLFSDTEKIKVIQSCFDDHKKEDGFSKSKFNTAIQNLYISGTEFSFNKSTKDKFESIFEFIKEKLAMQTLDESDGKG